jgi:hypothetical protein
MLSENELLMDSEALLDIEEDILLLALWICPNVTFQ